MHTYAQRERERPALLFIHLESNQIWLWMFSNDQQVRERSKEAKKVSQDNQILLLTWALTNDEWPVECSNK